MGTSHFAVPILKSLYQNGYPISVVYTQPPKKSNRGQKLNKSPINSFSENISLDVRTPQKLKNNNHEEEYLSKLKPAIDQTTTAIDFINPFKVNKIGSGNFII